MNEVLIPEQLVIVLAMITISLIYAYIVVYYMIRRRGRVVEKVEGEKKFHQTLTEGLKSGALMTMDDLANVYKGVFGLSSEDLSYRYGISRQLQRFIVELVSKSVDKSLDNQTVVAWKEKISEFIRINEEGRPYAELPAGERNVLNDIALFLKSGNTEGVRRKISELAGMIQARNDDLNRVRNTNKWAVPLSVVGMLLTVAFGIIGVFAILR